MTGYIKSTIDFDAIQKDIDAAKSLETAGRTDSAKDVLKDMVKKLETESK